MRTSTFFAVMPILAICIACSSKKVFVNNTAEPYLNSHQRTDRLVIQADASREAGPAICIFQSASPDSIIRRTSPMYNEINISFKEYTYLDSIIRKSANRVLFASDSLASESIKKNNGAAVSICFNVDTDRKTRLHLSHQQIFYFYKDLTVCLEKPSTQLSKSTKNNLIMLMDESVFIINRYYED